MKSKSDLQSMTVKTEDPELLEILHHVKINRQRLINIEREIMLVPDSDVDRTLVENITRSVQQGVALLLGKLLKKL